MTTVALLGAGGKIGYRLAEKLGDSEHRLLCLEVSQEGIDRLAQLGLETTPQEEALKEADVAILAVPDHLIGVIAEEIVPRMKSGAMVMCLDAAVPNAGLLPKRDDIAYFVVHPCHPPLFNDEVDPDARKDHFGGEKARQSIVCALLQGAEDDYATGVEIARLMFAPVTKAHRVTVEQMALLEPALSETVLATSVAIVREALDEVIRMGVPEEAAWDFAMGHYHVAIAMLFGYTDAEMSDAAKLVIERAKETVFQPNWKDVFKRENILAEVEAITRGASADEIMQAR